MIAALAKLHRESLKLPYKLAYMVARYIEGVNDGRDPVALFRNGANLINNTFMLADRGDAETLAAMKRDGIDATSMALAAELFSSAADEIEREKAAA